MVVAPEFPLTQLMHTIRHNTADVRFKFVYIAGVRIASRRFTIASASGSSINGRSARAFTGRAPNARNTASNSSLVC
ncbi:conserved hypothetical protein [Ricinus communis]|uniref:Uncharacterized protein n=1 Tax=Ricinus communis TaxID=3988 RepID=B9T933_RICCO|nr:conserved hypothetical protein [Ricinus communis]